LFFLRSGTINRGWIKQYYFSSSPLSRFCAKICWQLPDGSDDLLRCK